MRAFGETAPRSIIIIMQFSNRHFSPFNEKRQTVQFTCLRAEFVVDLPPQQLRIIVCDKYTFVSAPVNQRQAHVNQVRVATIRRKSSKR